MATLPFPPALLRRELRESVSGVVGVPLFVIDVRACLATPRHLFAVPFGSFWQKMAANAVCFLDVLVRSTGRGKPCMFSSRNSLQMLRIAAAAILAQVVNLLVRLDRANEEFVGQAVRSCHGAIACWSDANNPVALGFCALPVPATGKMVCDHGVHQSFAQCFSHPANIAVTECWGKHWETQWQGGGVLGNRYTGLAVAAGSYTNNGGF